MKVLEEVWSYKYNGKELDRMHGLDWYDYGARHYDAVLGRWMCMDPKAEKYYSVSPYAYCGNNPVNAIDLCGDSITMDIQSIMAIYNGLEEGTHLSMKFNNGVLDPHSIQEVVSKSDDPFLQDLNEIAIDKQMVELNVTDQNTYVIDGTLQRDLWGKPEDYNVMDEEEPRRCQLMNLGYSPGRTIRGNLGQTLYPMTSNELKRSVNNHIKININNLANLNQRSCGVAHEFAHIVFYLRNLPHNHDGTAGDFIYGRQWNVMKRFGYDYVDR